jgi:hypothetical protein
VVQAKVVCQLCAERFCLFLRNNYFLIMSTFTAVAVTYDDRIPFGPFFETEDAAWKWLHSSLIDEPIPVHNSLEVMQQT